MDPKQTLLLCNQAIKDNELDEAYWLLEAYRDWRNRGGFEPIIDGIAGDTLAVKLAASIDKRLAADKTAFFAP